MNRKRIKFLNVIVLLIIILLVGMIFSVFFNINVAKAETDIVNFDDYTNNDFYYFSGIELKIKDYSDSMVSDKSDLFLNIQQDYANNGEYASTIKYFKDTATNTIKISANGDDPITQIVPKYLFQTANSGIVHIGLEYGFFVKTDLIANGVYLSNVFVFDIDNKVGKEDKDQVRFRMQNLFQREYVYIASQVDSIPTRKGSMGGNYLDSSLNDSIGVDSNVLDVVVPLPYFSHQDVYYFSESKRYYLTNIVNMIDVYNEQHLNVYDENYDPNEDNGRFITQQDVSYNATIYSPNNNYLKDAGKVMLNSLLQLSIAGLGELIPGLSYLGVVKDYVNDFVNLKTHTLSDVGKDYVLQPKSLTADGQIKEYGGLCKSSMSHIYIDESQYDYGSFLFYNRGDFFGSAYDLPYTKVKTDFDGVINSVWEARIVRGFKVEFTNAENKKDKIEGFNIHDFKKADDSDREYKELQKDLQINLLPNGDNLFFFVPMMTGNYTIKTNGATSPVIINYDKSIGGCRINGQNTTKLNENDIAYEVGLKQGCAYCFRIAYEDVTQSGQFDISIEFTPQEIFLGENDVFVDDFNFNLRFYAENNMYYSIGTNDSDFSCWVYDNNYNFVYSKDYGYELNAGEYYYIRINKRISNLSKKIVVEVVDRMIVTMMDEDNVIDINGMELEYSKTYYNPLPDIEIEGYIFDGWWTSPYEYGKQVTNENIAEFIKPEITLYVRWTPIPYNIFYEENGGYEIEDGIYTTKYDTTLNKDVHRDGYVFCGWYDNAQLSGDVYEILPAGNLGDKTFYAKWIKGEWKVDFDVSASFTDNEPAILDSEFAVVNYNQYFKLPVPVAYGFEFDGWYYDGYILADKEGNSLVPYTFEENIKVQAKWVREVYYIRINADGSFKWLTKDGDNYAFTDTETSMEYITGFCPNCYIMSQLEKINDPVADAMKKYLYKSGHIYKFMAVKDGVDNNGNVNYSLACWQGSDFGKDFGNREIIEIYPQYEVEKEFKIFIKIEGSDGYELACEGDYNSIIEYKFLPTKTGYTLTSLKVDNSENNSRYENSNTLAPNSLFWNVGEIKYMPDLSENEEMNGRAIYLVGNFEANKYEINLYDKDTLIDTIEVVYNESYTTFNGKNFPVLTKTGYIFDGWNTKENGQGDKVADRNGNVANWTIANNCDLFIKWTPNLYVVSFDFCGGSDGTQSIEVLYNTIMPKIDAPTRTGYTFLGYFTEPNGNGEQYYDNRLSSSKSWITADNGILYAHWEANKYIVTFDFQGGSGGTISVEVTFGELLPKNLSMPIKFGYKFEGYYLGYNGNKECYFNSEMRQIKEWNIAEDKTLYAFWEAIEINFQLWAYYVDSKGVYNIFETQNLGLIGDEIKTFEAEERTGFTFKRWYLYGSRGSQRDNISIDLTTNRKVSINLNSLKKLNGFNKYLRAEYTKNECIAEGSMITLADGTQKAVEQLEGNEQLLVWNMFTGKFDTAPILFIDSDPAQNYEVINLHFSDGTIVKVIAEHAFWDFNLNQYVFLRNDADKYIGHWFNKQNTDSNGNMTWGKVQLISVEVKEEITRAFSPVTYGHLCYYVNGLLTMPGATEGLINIFDVDSESMKIDINAYNADIEKYGLFTYEEFAELIPVTEQVFNAFNGQYLKVSIGKGLITLDEIEQLINRYSEFFN